MVLRGHEKFWSNLNSNLTLTLTLSNSKPYPTDPNPTNVGTWETKPAPWDPPCRSNTHVGAHEVGMQAPYKQRYGSVVSLLTACNEKHY